jgi:hypothetical protein
MAAPPRDRWRLERSPGCGPSLPLHPDRRFANRSTIHQCEGVGFDLPEVRLAADWWDRDVA